MTPIITPDQRHDHDTPERRLWRAVVTQAVRDALLVDPTPDGPPRERLVAWGGLRRSEITRIRDEARVWLLWDRDNFFEVCDNSGLDWRELRRNAQQMLERASATVATA